MLLHRKSTTFLWISVFLAAFINFNSAWIPCAKCADSDETEEINSKAEKYFELLSESPNGDYIYDRFYDAWLETGTVEELEKYLLKHDSQAEGVNSKRLLAYFYERQGNDNEALKYFEQACSDNSDSQVLYEKASVEARLLKFDSAIADLIEAQKNNENKDLSIKISKLLAKLYIRTSQKDSATQVWENLIKTNPDDEDIYEDMIELQISEGLYEEAINTSDILLEKTEDSYKKIMRQLRKADIYQYSGKNEQAIEIYTKTLQLVGQDSWLENQICTQIERLFRKQDNIRDLEGYWENLIAEEPQRISIKKRLAQLLLQFAEVDKALEIYQEIVRISPGDKKNQQAYIQALRTVSQTSKALDLMKQLCQQNPDDNELLIDLADLYYQNLDEEEVVATLGKFLEQSDKSEYVFLRVAKILENYNYEDEVMNVFEKLMAQYPESLSAKEAYAEVLYKYKEKEKALELWDNLAVASDMQTLLRIAKTARSRGFAESALYWLEDRYEEFENEISYLNQICETAIYLGLYEKSLPWLEKQLAMADRYSLIQAAIRQRIQIENKSGNINDIITELKSRTNISAQETCLLAEMLEYNRLSKEAQDVLDKFIEDANNLDIPNEIRNTRKEIAYQQKIHLYSVSRQWVEAADCTRKLIAMKGMQNSAYVLELINLYQRASQWQLALDWIPAWKKASPGSTEPYLTESRILRKLYRIDAAIETLRAADQVFENNKDILSELASLYRSYNRSSEAYRLVWRLYDEAEDPSTKLGYVRDLASISQSMGNIDSLIGKLQEQKANNRTSVIPILALAEAYRQADRYEERIQALMEASRLKPNDITLLTEIARIEESEGLWEQAIETLKQAMPLDNTDSTKNKLARLYIQYGNEEEGYRLLFNISDNKSIDPMDVQNIVMTMAAESNWDMAEKYLEEVLPKFPDDYRLHYLYALCLEENYKFNEAMEKFGELLEMKAEIPGNTNQSILSQQSNWAEQMKEIAPPGTADILSIQQALSQALRYRRDYNNLPYWYYPNRSSGSVNIIVPQNIDDLSGFAIAHILSLISSDFGYESSEADTELQKEMAKNILQKNNFAYLEYVLDINSLNINNVVSSIARAAPSHPEDEALQALWIIYNDQNFDNNEEHIRYVFEMFETKYPSLSCILGLIYGSVKEDGTDMLKKSLEIIDTIKKPNDILLSRCTSLISLQESLLTDEQKSFLTEKAINWFSDPNTQTTQSRNSVFYQISRLLMNIGDTERFVKFVNNEVKNFKNYQNQNQNITTSSSTSQIRFRELNYPPTYNLPDFPSYISQYLLDFGRSNTNLFGKLYDPNNPEEFINKFDNPVLKSIICIVINQQEKALKILEEEVEAETKSIATYIYLASILAQQNELEKVVGILGNIQALSPDIETQHIVDAAIVTYSRNIELSENTDVIEATREAVLRLSKENITQSSYRNILIEAMNKLGLNDEARLYARRYSSGTSSTNMQQLYIQQGLISQAAIRTQNLNSVQYDKIVNLLTEEKKEPAIRLLLSDLNFIASECLLPERSRNNSNYNDRIALVHSFQLEDKIIELANPSPSKNIRKLLTFARLCDLIGKTEMAEQAYKEVLQIRPKEFGALIWLAFLNYDKAPDKAAEYLFSVETRHQNQLGRQLSTYIQNNYYQESIENTFKFTELAGIYLDNIKDANSMELSWAANIPQTIANSYSRNNIRLPHLYAEPQNSNVVNMTRSGRARTFVESPSSMSEDELTKKRREIHNKYCYSMLRIPLLAAQGFACLHAEAKARNDVNDTIEALALDAFLKSNPQRNYAYTGLINSYSWGTGRDKRLISPMEFLIQSEWSKGTLNELVEKVTPILDKDNRVAESRQLNYIASLYESSPEDYIAQAKEFLSSDIISGNQTPSPQAVINIDTAISQIIEIYFDRSLKVNLNQLLIDQINLDNQNSLYQFQNYARNYMMLLTVNNPETANDFLEKMVSKFLGPKEQRKEFIIQNYNRNRSSSAQILVNINTNSTNYQRINICFNLIRNLAQESNLVFNVLSQFDGIEEYLPDMQYYIQNGINNAIQKATNNRDESTEYLTEFITFLNDSPFIRDINSFRTLPVPQLQKSSAYSYLIYRLFQSQNSRYNDMRLGLKTTLAKQISEQEVSGNAFGMELLIAQLSDDKQREVYNCLGKYWDKFQKLDKARQQEISVMISDTVGLIAPDDDSLSENVKQVVARLNELRKLAGQEKIDDFLKHKKFEDFGVSDSQFVQNTSNLIANIVSYDVNASIEILSKGIALIDDAARRGQFRYSSSRDLSARVFSQLQENLRTLSYSSLNFMIKVIRDTNDPSINIEPYNITQIESPLSNRFQQYRNTSNNNQLEALKKLYKEIGPNLEGGDLSALTSIFRRVYDRGNWNEQTINEAITWASEESKSGKYRSLAKVFEISAAIYKQQRFTNRSFRGATNDNPMAEIEKYFQQSLSDPNLSIQWRMMTNNTISQYLPNIISTELTNQTIDLIIEGWSSYTNIRPQYCTNTIRRFLDSKNPDTNPQNRITRSPVYVPDFNSPAGISQPVNAQQNSSDPNWTITAAKLSDAYQAFRKPAQAAATLAGSSVRSVSSSNYEGNPDIQLAMLEINLVLGKDDAVRAMLDGFDNRIGTYLDCWALLIKYNKANMFKAVVEKQWNNRINHMGVVRFSNEIEDNLPGCIETLQSDDMQYFAQVQISSMNDDNNPRNPKVRRNDRLKNLAEKFGEITFNSIPIKHKILETYINQNNLLPLVSKYIIEEGKNINPSVLTSTQNSTLVQTQSRILAAYCIASLLEENDPNVFISTTRSLSTYPGRNMPSGVRQALDTMGSQLVNISNTIQNDWTKSQISALATATADFITTSSQTYDPGRLLSNLVVFHIIANREDEIQPILARLPSNIQQNMQGYLRLSELSSTLGRFTRNRNLPIEERIDIIKRFYQTEILQAAMERENQRDMLSYLTSYNVLSRQEIDQYRELLKDLFVQTKQIEALLKTTSLQNVQGSQNESQLRQYISSLLNSTMWQDTDLCIKILLKVESLLNNYCERTGSYPANIFANTSFKSNDDFICSILEQRNSDYFSVADLGIIVGLTRDANSPQIVLNESYLQRVSSAINNRHRSILQESGQNRLIALQKMYSEIGPYFGKGDASGYSSFLTSMVQNSRIAPDMSETLSWAKEKVQKGEYPNLAKEIYIIAMGQNSPMFPPGRISGRQPVNDEYEKTLREHYLSVLEDSKLSVIWRLMALEEYRKRSSFDNNLNDENSEVIFEAVPLVIEGWKLYPNLTETYYMRIVTAFAKLQDRPQWKELAGKLSQAYEQFRSNEQNPTAETPAAGEIAQRNDGTWLPLPSASGRVGRAASGRISSPQIVLNENRAMQIMQQQVVSIHKVSRDMEQAMLEIRIVLNEDELIKKQLNEQNSSLGKNLDTWVLLSQYGKHSILKDVIEKNWKDVSTNTNLRYTREIENNIAKCLEEISQEDIRYFAEVVLSALPDSTQIEHLPEVSHKDRIIRLAEQYSKVIFDEHAVRQRILALLINEPDAIQFVKNGISEQASNIDLNSIFTNFNNTARDQFNLALANSCNKLLAGDPNNFIKLANIVASNTSSSNQNLGRQLLTIMRDNLLKTADYTKSNWTVEQMAAFAYASTEILAQKSITLNNPNSFLVSNYIFYMLGRKKSELTKAHERFSSIASNALQNMQLLQKLPQYYSQLGKYLSNRNLSLEDRLDIIDRLNNTYWINGSLRQIGRGDHRFNIVDLLIQNNIVTKQEAIDNSSAFLKYINPALTRFLDTKNISEIGFDFNQFESYINTILSNITIYDTDLALKIITKAEELNQQLLNSENAHVPYGMINISSRILSRMIQQDSNKLQALDIIIKLMRDTKDNEMAPDNSLFQIDREVANFYMRTQEYQTNQLELIKNMYEQIGQCTGKENASGISDIFNIMFSNQQWRDNNLLDSVIQWSHEQAQSGDYPSLAREIEMIATVYRNRPGFGRTFNEDIFKPVTEHYINVLKDENLPLPWRLMTIHAMENWISYPSFDKLADQAMEVLTKCSDKSLTFSWDLHSNLLSRFIRSAHEGANGLMPHNNPDFDFSPLRKSWIEPATKTLSSYLKYQERNNALQASPVRGRMGARQSASISELAMLEISLLLKENETAKKLLLDNFGTLKTSSCSLALLIQYQDNSLLKEFVDKYLENITLDTRGVYNSQMEDRISNSLNEITLTEDQKYYLKVLLHSHNDRNQRASFPGRPEGQRIFSTRQQRIINLAKQFNEVTFENDNLKKNVLFYLTKEPNALPYISKALSEQAQKINLASLNSRSTQNVYLPESLDFQIYLNDKISMLINGDPNGFYNILNYCQSTNNIDDSMPSYLINAYIRTITGINWNAGTLPAFLDVSDALISSLNNRYLSSNILQLISCKTALLLLTEDSAVVGQDTLKEIESTFNILNQFSEIFRGSPNNLKLKMGYNEFRVAHDVFSKFMNSTSMPFEKRMEVLNKLYSINQFSQAINEASGNSALSILINLQIFSIEELFNNNDAIMSLPVNKDIDWEVLASYQVRNEKIEDAEKSWYKVIETGLISESKRNNVQSYQSFLNRYNLRDRALDYWSSYNTESLSEYSLSQYETLINMLSN